jgi:hypothetical protein
MDWPATVVKFLVGDYSTQVSAFIMMFGRGRIPAQLGRLQSSLLEFNSRDKMVDPSEPPSIVDPVPSYSERFFKDEHILSGDQNTARNIVESAEKDFVYADAGHAECDETESTDDGVSCPDIAGATNCTGLSEESPFAQQEDDQTLDSGFVSTPTAGATDQSHAKQQPTERGEPEERGFSTSSQALDAAEAARMKGNVAYSLGHLYNAISMYLLANRHLAYAATLESGAESTFPADSHLSNRKFG